MIRRLYPKIKNSIFRGWPTGYLDRAIETQDMIELTYRPYLSDDLTTPQMDPPITLVITDIHVDCYKITATARMMDIGNKSFPSENYTVKNYPGLTR